MISELDKRTPAAHVGTRMPVHMSRSSIIPSLISEAVLALLSHIPDTRGCTRSYSLIYWIRNGSTRITRSYTRYARQYSHYRLIYSIRETILALLADVIDKRCSTRITRSYTRYSRQYSHYSLTYSISEAVLALLAQVTNIAQLHIILFLHKKQLTGFNFYLTGLFGSPL